MANENAKIDDNYRKTLLGVTDDASEEIRRLLVDATTGRLKVTAVVTGQLGYDTIQEEGVGLTQRNDMNFIGSGITAADDAGNTRTNITLSTFLNDIVDLGDPGTDRILFWDDSAGIYEHLTVGTGLQITGTTLSASASALGYATIEDDGVAVTARTIMNFENYFTITDDAVDTTDINLNITELEPALDLNNLSGQIDLTTQVTGLLPSTNIDITDLESTLDLSTIAGQIDLTTQVSGSLPVANGGTGATTLAGIVHGTGTAALTGIPLTTDGAILIGDGAAAPTTLAAFTAAAGFLKHESGGLEFDASAIAKGGLIAGSGAGTMAIETVGANDTVLTADSTSDNGIKWAVPSAGNKIGINTTEVTVNTTTSETTLFQRSITGGTLSTNNGLRYTIDISDFGIRQGTDATFRLKYGTTTIATMVVGDTGASVADITGNAGELHGMILADGSTSAQKGNMRLRMGEVIYETNGSATTEGDKIIAAANGAAVEDSTGALNLTITVQFSASNAADTITGESMVTEKIN